MPLTTISSSIQQLDHQPSFAISSGKHAQGAWVVARNPADQNMFWGVASNAAAHGQQVKLTYGQYVEKGDDSEADRHYLDVTHVTPV